MHDLKPILGTKRPDENIDGLANGDTLRSQQSVVCRRLLRDVETDHVELRQGQEEGGDLASFARGADALHDFAIYEVADSDQVLLEAPVDLCHDTGNASPEILDPGRCVDYDHINLFSSLRDPLPR